MRPHGRFRVDPSYPSARGVCDFCGFQYTLRDLKWEFDWRGPRLQNLRFLVCQSCQDKPQPNGQRTYILPPDPVPVMNARPEFNVPDNNPYSAVGAAPNIGLWPTGNQIGNMVNAGNVPAAFDGVLRKAVTRSATISVSNSSYNNYVGINWAGNANSLNAPSSLQPPVIQHSVTSFTAVAPFNATFGSTAFVIQGSPTTGPWGAWTTIYSGSPLGVNGETVSGQTTGGTYQFHRIAFLGSANGVGGSAITLAQVQFSVGEIGVA